MNRERRSPFCSAFRHGEAHHRSLFQQWPLAELNANPAWHADYCSFMAGTHRTTRAWFSPVRLTSRIAFCSHELNFGRIPQRERTTRRVHLGEDLSMDRSIFHRSLALEFLSVDSRLINRRGKEKKTYYDRRMNRG